ncbi:MAG: hypothetical protein ACOX7I_02290 [Oscillospiraceae bacterium]|jgi:hypothetical protein
MKLEKALEEGNIALELIVRARKRLVAVDVVSFFAMLPLIGIPFGFLRTKLLSDISRMADRVKEYAKVLNELEIEPYIHGTRYVSRETCGMLMDYATPNVSPAYYVGRTHEQYKEMQRKISRIGAAGEEKAAAGSWLTRRLPGIICRESF